MLTRVLYGILRVVQALNLPPAAMVLLVPMLILLVPTIYNRMQYLDDDPFRGARAQETPVLGETFERPIYLTQRSVDAGETDSTRGSDEYSAYCPAWYFIKRAAAKYVQGWCPSESLWFYNTTQGSALLPYDLFVSLKVKGVSSEPFVSANNMDKYRFLAQNKTTFNPDALPVGFVKETYKGNYDWYEYFWSFLFFTNVKKDYVGLTCAACHTGQINLQDKDNKRTIAVRIDGGAGLGDLDSLQRDLVEGLRDTQTNESKLRDYVETVLGRGNYRTAEEVKRDLDYWIRRLDGYNDVNNSDLAYGYGRLDAFGRIFNRVHLHVISRRQLWDTLLSLRDSNDRALLTPDEVGCVMSHVREGPIIGRDDMAKFLLNLKKYSNGEVFCLTRKNGTARFVSDATGSVGAARATLPNIAQSWQSGSGPQWVPLPGVLDPDRRAQWVMSGLGDGSVFAESSIAARDASKRLVRRTTMHACHNKNTFPRERADRKHVAKANCLYREVLDQVFPRPNAPVSIPHIWDAPHSDYVQWNGLAGNATFGPLGRNVGQVVGVFAMLDWKEYKPWWHGLVEWVWDVPLVGSPIKCLANFSGCVTGQTFKKKSVEFKTSVDKFNVRRLEAQLSKLRSPKWPTLGNEDASARLNRQLKIDKDKKRRGRQLYDQYCLSCHHRIDRASINRRVQSRMYGLDVINTDRRAAIQSHDARMKTGNLEDTILGTEVGDILLKEEAASVAMLKATVKGTIAAPDPDRSPPLRIAMWLYNLGLAWFENPIDYTIRAGDYEETTPTKPFRSLKSYKARPLNGVWATAPFLHNGSVPTLYDLLSPETSRPRSFKIGQRAFDPEKVGLRDCSGSECDGLFEFDTTKPGNENSGHEYGPMYVCVRAVAGQSADAGAVINSSEQAKDSNDDIKTYDVAAFAASGKSCGQGYRLAGREKHNEIRNQLIEYLKTL